ncbi:hypothetical protein RYX36_033782, partial [Vicia faba]
MVRSDIYSRALMQWRVMDMIVMQFEDESFGVFIDKSGLNALMDPNLGPTLGNISLSL